MIHLTVQLGAGKAACSLRDGKSIELRPFRQFMEYRGNDKCSRCHTMAMQFQAKAKLFGIKIS